jgi:predicted HicB family RNase H-like nuclease
MAILNLRDIPDDLHRRTKAQAAMEGITIKELVIKALKEYLKKKKGR